MESSSRRTALSLGLGLTTVFGLLSRAFGKDDKSATPAGTAEQPPGSGIGTLNVQAVLKGYEKVKTLREHYKKEVLARQNILMELAAELHHEKENQDELKPGIPEHDESTAKIARLKSEMESERQKVQAELSQKEAETMAKLYKEVRDAAVIVARRRKLIFVLKIDGDLDPGSPLSVARAVEQVVICAPPEADITNEVIALLNQK